MKKLTTTLALLLAVVSLTNCGSKGFESSSLSAQDGVGKTGDPANPGYVPDGNSPLADQVNAIDLKGEIDNNSLFGKALTFDFDKKRGEFIIMLPLPNGILVMPSGAFSKYPDITFSPMIDAEGRMKFGVRVPIKYIIKGLSTLPPSKLPNGDDLPMMPQGLGELPSLGLSFPAHNNTQVSLYLGVNAIGLYVTLPTNAAVIPFGFTAPVKKKDKSVVGYLTFVPAKAMYPPGLFVSTIIPPSISRILEDYFKL